MTDIKFTPDSLNDLHEIKKYIAEELGNINSANKIIQNIMNNIKQLKDYPYSGAALTSIININTDYRYIFCNNYTVFYRVEDNNVLIIRILYSKRDFMQNLFN